MKRSHLPLNALRVFDAAARHLSFTRAADELAVTPAAVGQQIRALEDVLGVILFRRTPRGLELTVEAAAGLDALRGGFLAFEDSVRAMRAGQSSKALTIAAPRELVANWLAARLAALSAADPELRWTLLSTDDGLSFAEANLDLSIQWGEAPADMEATALAPGGLTAIAPAGADSGHAVVWPGAPEPAVAAADRPLLRVADAGLAINAVAAGLGHAVIPTLLMTHGVPQGVVAGEVSAGPNGYWLAAPAPQWRQKKVLALVAALTADQGA